jgi:hypothetical protein
MPDDDAAVNAVSHDGDLLALSIGNGLIALYNTEDPAAPVHVETIPHAFNVTDLALRDELLFVLETWNGVRVYDVSDPAEPVQISMLTSIDQARHITLAGDVALVLDPHVMHVLDISSPADVSETGMLTMSRPYGNAIAADGSHAAVVAGSYLVIVDFSVPGLPVEMSEVEIGIYNNDVAVRGNLVSVARGSGGWTLVDIAIPSLPIEVGTASDPAASAGEVELVGDRMYGFDTGHVSSGVYIFDVSAPAEPQHLGSYVVAVKARSIQIVDGVAFVVDPKTGLRILDVSDPTHAMERSFFQTSSEPGAADIRDGVAAVGLREGQGLLLIDVSDVDVPVEMGLFVDSYTDNITEVLIDDDTVYFIGSYSHWLRAVDVSDPHNPQAGGGLYLSGYPISMALSGDHLLVGTEASSGAGDPELHIVDVSVPLFPQLVSSTPRSSSVNAIAVSGDHAYLGSNTMRVVDISTPQAPVDVGLYFAPYEIRDISLRHNHAYLATGHVGLVVVDVTSPQTPYEVGGLAGPNSFGSLDVMGRHLFATQFNDGILSVDVGCLPVFWDDFESGGTWAWSEVVVE